jgi:hypothetical protein
MTQDEINQMVEQAGFHGVLSIGVVMDSKQLETFTRLVELRYQKKIADLENIICQRHWDVLQEREACAKLCETLGVHPALNVWCGGPDWYKHGKDCAAAIRARGERA